MKILFLTDNFPPEVNAPASRTFEHCSEWVKQGVDVTVITCVPNFPKGKVYEGYRNKLYQTEMMNGIRVVRVWTYMVPNKGFLKRTLDYISFSVSSFIAGLFQKADVIVATSPHFFTALSGRTLKCWKRTPWIMEVRDLWPEEIKTAGVMKDNAIIKYFEWEEYHCYKSAKKIVVVTDAYKKYISGRGIDPKKIHVVKNGVNRDLFSPMEKDQALLKELGLEGKKVIGYIGTIGLNQQLDFIMQCAKGHQEKDDYHFLFIGEGAEKEKLKTLQLEWGLTNVTFLDAVPKNIVKRYISILDICLINLKKNPANYKVIPSKIFENAGMGIPILMGVLGEAQEIVESHHAGLCFEPEDEEDFNNKLNQLMEPAYYEECKKGCLKLADDFDRKVLAAKMLEVIKSAAKK